MSLLLLLSCLLCGGAVGLAILSLWSLAQHLPRRIQQVVPRIVGLAACLAVGLWFSPLVGAVSALAVLLGPWVLRAAARRRRSQALEESQDALIGAWADALTTVPNLTEAIATSAEYLRGPMRGEVEALLAEVRLGVDIETALTRFSERLKVPGVEAAVCAAVLGRRTGGDLSAMLRRIAASTREMSRLEGVIRTKTSEGRYQAWVMGGIPIALLFGLDWLNPEWTAPLWDDPLGWLLLGLAAILELVAVALILKITAVEI